MEERRILGIDFGTKRIGLALSDPLRILATALAIVENDGNHWKELERVVREHKVEFVVVGMPLTLKGEQGGKALDVKMFVEELRRRLQVEVVFWDERFTTVLADQYRRDSGIGRKARRTTKKALDGAAAAIMLQGFLDRTKNSLSC